MSIVNVHVACAACQVAEPQTMEEAVSSGNDGNKQIFTLRQQIMNLFQTMLLPTCSSMAASLPNRVLPVHPYNP